LSENLWRYLYPVLEEKVVKMELNQIKDLMQRVKKHPEGYCRKG